MDRLHACSTPFGITASGTPGVSPVPVKHPVLNAFRHHGERDDRDALGESPWRECSTPFGITASGTVSRLLNHRTFARAQRLSASRRAGPLLMPLISMGVSCSTPFGITASGTSGWGMVFPVITECSTPFGITASGTTVMTEQTQRDPCSTPFGITASGTMRAAKRSPWRACAQRLSASRRAGPSSRPKAREIWTCSTPFGITASGTSQASTTSRVGPRAQRLSASRRAGPLVAASWSARARVLNAFRHHGERDSGLRDVQDAEEGCSTPFGITASGTPQGRLQVVVGGPVLNAFRHHGERDSRKPKRPMTGARFRAQRLSASRRAGQHGRQRVVAHAEVLNAFRHHGERDEVHPLPAAQGPQVLNAFRHHGERDLGRSAEVEQVHVCSTPFGITASGTRPLSRCLPPSTVRAQRLSASRRAGPRPNPLPEFRRFVLNAFRHHGERDLGAQRAGQVEQVLNAFRHHGERDRASACSPPRAVRAQRLSASRRAGRPARFVSNMETMCSTPFGITASGTLPSVGASDVVARCSTPFGITASGTRGAQPLWWRRPRCSTPFGITASGTRRSPPRLKFWGLCSTPFGITASGTPGP